MACDIVGDIPRKGQPVLFLDFDDVLNVSAPNPDFPCPPIDEGDEPYAFDMERRLDVCTESGRKASVPIRVSSDMLGDIRSLLNDDVALLWLTSWREQTVMLDSIFGFGRDGMTVGYVDWRRRGFSDYGMFGKVSGLCGLYQSDGDEGGKPPLDSTNRFVSVDDTMMTATLAGALMSEMAFSLVGDDDKTAFADGCRIDGLYGDIPGMSKVSDCIAAGYGIVGAGDSDESIVPFMSVTPDYRFGLTRGQMATIRSFLFE